MSIKKLWRRPWKYLSLRKAFLPKRDILWLIRCAVLPGLFVPISPRHGEKGVTELLFIAKLSDVESEACETQVWIEFAVRCKYLDTFQAEKLTDTYEQIMGQIVKMIEESDKWLIRNK